MTFKKGNSEQNYQNLVSEVQKLQLTVQKLQFDIGKKNTEIEKLKEQIDNNNSGDESESSDSSYEPVNEYFKFGKYKGQSFKYIAINHPSYVSWVMALNSPTDHFRDFLHFFYKWKLKEFNNSKKF